jgi:hypothetical protein
MRLRFLRWLFSPVLWILIIISTVFLTLLFGRQWYDSLLVRLDQNKSVHVDRSVVSTGINSQIRPTVTLVYKNQDGKRVRVIADAEEYSDFVNQQVMVLENAKTEILTLTAKHLHQNLSQEFLQMQERLERFADWYFAYSTTYKILWEATVSTTRHFFTAEALPLADLVAYDVEKYLQKHYETIVLRPELTDSQLRARYHEALNLAHESYLNRLATMQTAFQTLVAKYTSHLESPVVEKAEMVLDWESQFNKINMADYEKGPTGTALGATLIAGGAVAGKTIAGVAGKGLTGKMVGGAASKGVLAKLSAPFVSKAMIAGTGGAVGTLGGPLGTAIGAIGGLSIDYAINEGVELTQRETFIADLTDALITTQAEWESQMIPSLQQAIDIWLEDTIQLLPRYDSTK